MTDFRIETHPILPIPTRPVIEFFWQDQKLTAFEGETISAALFAHQIRIFGHHPKDHAPQGIFCANGQCAQCMVLADNRPVKACMELVRAGYHVQPLDGLPELPLVEPGLVAKSIQRMDIPVLIIGGGPAGLSAAIELGQRGIKVLVVDDKHRVGGKLVLQTHRFFGSTNMVYAGTRGIDIATRLEKEINKYPFIETWLQSTALAVFSDQQVGNSQKQPRIYSRKTSGCAGCHRCQGKFSRIQRQYPARGIWRRRIPNSGEPRPGPTG